MALPAATLAFLEDLAQNNTKEWFKANQKRYESELKKPGRAWIEEINETLATVAPDWVTPAGKAINRINRDIRFSKDRTPYNTHLWAGFQHQGSAKGTAPAYYVGLSPTGFGVGCGSWAPPKPQVDNLRGHIAANHEELTELLATLENNGFNPLEGDAYKRVPKPWAADHPAGAYLKHKGFHTRIEFDRELALSDEGLPEIAKRFAQMKPLVDFLYAGLSS
mgnify:CR=1 FL=1